MARDALSLPLLEVGDRIAGHAWENGEIAWLLQRITSAQAHEVEFLAGLRAGGPS